MLGVVLSDSSLSPEYFLAGSADVPNKDTKTSQLNFMQDLSQEDADEALLFLWIALPDGDGSSLCGRRATWNDDAGANGDDNNAGSVALEFAGFTVARTDCGDVDGDGGDREHSCFSGAGHILRRDGDKLHRPGCFGDGTTDKRGDGGAAIYFRERQS